LSGARAHVLRRAGPPRGRNADHFSPWRSQAAQSAAASSGQCHLTRPGAPLPFDPNAALGAASPVLHRHRDERGDDTAGRCRGRRGADRCVVMRFTLCNPAAPQIGDQPAGKCHRGDRHARPTASRRELRLELIAMSVPSYPPALDRNHARVPVSTRK